MNQANSHLAYLGVNERFEEFDRKTFKKALDIVLTQNEANTHKIISRVYELAANRSETEVYHWAYLSMDGDVVYQKTTNIEPLGVIKQKEAIAVCCEKQGSIIGTEDKFKQRVFLDIKEKLN
ncbi:hypothetical protein [Paenibacillus pini]|nr:hypothetical protein [Paenibacillus pini]